MSNLQLRLISAAVLIPVVFGAIISGGIFFAGLIAIAFILSLYEWIMLSAKTRHKTAFTIAGLIYIPVCFYAFYLLRMQFEDGIYLVLMMLMTVFATDTGAYFFGKNFGRHKLAPRISPSKSWEGLAGGCACAGILLYLMMEFAPQMASFVPNAVQPLYFPLAFVAGAILGCIGQAGDLIESFLKRQAGAKDSGRIIPGHGGILDRVDSILLIAPFFLLLALHAF